jgi:hypothetical protein
VRVVLGGTARPPGGLLVHAPFGTPPRDAVVDGASRRLDGGRAVRVGRLPATIVFRY